MVLLSTKMFDFLLKWDILLVRSIEELNFLSFLDLENVLV